MNYKRVFVQKKEGFEVEAKDVLTDIRETLLISEIADLKILIRYDLYDISEEEYELSKKIVFSDHIVDVVYENDLEIEEDEQVFAVEYLPGQYDQRADAALQCLNILSQNDKVKVKVAKLYVLKGKLSNIQVGKIKNYLINPVDSRQASLEKAPNFDGEISEKPRGISLVNDFISMNDVALIELLEEMNFSMCLEDIKFCQEYFKNEEKRNPTSTELKVIDIYWSDHCRHKTFNTIIEDVEFEDGFYMKPIKKAFKEYQKSKEKLGKQEQDISLMNIVLTAMQELKRDGKLEDLEQSDEINACSIEREVVVNGKPEKWLIMFKNETHNHPTEIEPFGGASTCLGGCIRDPLSGRAFVYQAMRISGSGNPTLMHQEIKGKLSQKKITKDAARGYSSYGNQIGISTGQVAEFYHEGYRAKRLELGAVIGAVPKKNVIREKPSLSDVIILLGGKTGRDGCGGATGSSKSHNENSINECNSEVQKGNPVVERKIQRLFRNEKAIKLIKRCNDFGAGGVCVAVGELCDGVSINLDLVPKKYEGLNGTEIAISESQERMAVVVSEKDKNEFITLAKQEALEAVEIAKVTNSNKMQMFWAGDKIVDIGRKFLDTGGVKPKVKVRVKNPLEEENYFLPNRENDWTDNLQEINHCSQKGLAEMFDNTIGNGSVISNFGGKYQMTPAEAMICKIPVLEGDTNSASLMSYGFNPYLSSWSPFHGSIFAIVESLAKLVASGGDYKKARLTFQEYFEKIGDDEEKWSKPFSAVLGAYYCQKMLEVPAIGGKDSMSGSFNELHVPPTFVSFAVDVLDTKRVISSEFKKVDSKVVILKAQRDKFDIPIFEKLKANFELVQDLISQNKVLSSFNVKSGGIAEAISKMSFGNKIGFEFGTDISIEELYAKDYGSIILEIDAKENLKELFPEFSYKILGKTKEAKVISFKNCSYELDELIAVWSKPLEKIFPTKSREQKGEIVKFASYENTSPQKSFYILKKAKPKVFMMVFPGTNCEYDTKKAFEKAGAEVEIGIFNNLDLAQIKESIAYFSKAINNSQILMIPGGFSLGDEPDGSGKFIATVLRNPQIAGSITKFLQTKDGLILGICNGFQALLRLGLIPFGQIVEPSKNYLALTHNNIKRHIAKMADVKVVSNLSPWLSKVNVGDIHTIAISHGEGRIAGDEDKIKSLFSKNQIATQYVDFSGILLTMKIIIRMARFVP